jgi:hypothetical protein
MTSPQQVMRTMKYAFIVSVLLFIFVTVRIPSKAANPPQHTVELIVIVLALVNVALGLNGRRFFARLAQANSSRGVTAGPMNQWMSANLFSLAMIESCALFALVLHILGSSTKLVGILFGCSLLGLFVWSPGTPPTPEDASGISR